MTGEVVAESLAVQLFIERTRLEVPNQDMELEGLAGVLAALDLPVRAARLFGAAEAMRERMSNPRRDDERDYYDRFTKLLRQSSNQAGIEAAWQEGRTISLEAAADYATEHL